MLISEFYNQEGRFKISEFREKHPDMDVYWETVAAVGAATGTTKLIKYALKNEGKRLNMCTALQGLIDEGVSQGLSQGLSQGRKEGRDETIIKTVRMLRKMNLSPYTISTNLKDSFQLSDDEIQKYFAEIK